VIESASSFSSRNAKPTVLFATQRGRRLFPFAAWIAIEPPHRSSRGITTIKATTKAAVADVKPTPPRKWLADQVSRPSSDIVALTMIAVFGSFGPQ
jgi:hypothetical protein